MSLWDNIKSFGQSALGSVAGFAGPLIGSLATGAFNASSARDQMRFQERMSSTAYQRAAKDLEAAGLNRVLALGQPASSPGGAGFTVPDLGQTMIAGSTAKQNISESKTRESLHRANEQASLASAKAATAEAQLKEDMANRIRQMLPYEMTESGVRIKSGLEGAEGQALDNMLKGLSISQQKVLKSLYEEFGPLALDWLKTARGVVTSGKDALLNWAKEGSTWKLGGLETNDPIELALQAFKMAMKANPTLKSASDILDYFKSDAFKRSSEMMLRSRQ